MSTKPDAPQLTAADICAEMAREAEATEKGVGREPFVLKGLEVAEILNGYFVGEGVAVMDTKTCSGVAAVIGIALAQYKADALREAERRIRAITQPAPSPVSAEELAHLFQCHAKRATHTIDCAMDMKRRGEWGHPAPSQSARERAEKLAKRIILWSVDGDMRGRNPDPKQVAELTNLLAAELGEQK